MKKFVNADHLNGNNSTKNQPQSDKTLQRFQQRPPSNLRKPTPNPMHRYKQPQVIEVNETPAKKGVEQDFSS